MAKNNLDNPFFLFIVLLLAIAVNIISSIHFLLIMLAGILFTAFYRCFKKRYLYSLVFVMVAFGTGASGDILSTFPHIYETIITTPIIRIFKSLNLLNIFL